MNDQFIKLSGSKRPELSSVFYNLEATIIQKLKGNDYNNDNNNSII